MTKPRILMIAGITAAAVVIIAVVALYGFREMRPARYAVIYRFSDGSDGSGPVPGLSVDAADNLYGVTFSGGKLRWGTIFKLSPPPPSSHASGAERSNASAEIPVWKEEVLSLNPNTVGGSPGSPMVWAQAGALYGITSFGGPSLSDKTHDGMLFKLDTSGPGLSNPVPVYSMPTREFNSRCSDLISDASGALYGTTSGAWRLEHGDGIQAQPDQRWMDDGHPLQLQRR